MKIVLSVVVEKRLYKVAFSEGAKERAIQKIK